MDFKNFLTGENKNKELYWALVLESGWIQAGVWEIIEEKAEVTSISPATPWETDEELISNADTALSAAIQNLPEDTPEPSKTVFGVPPSWVEGGQIKEEFLDKIKKICTELSLDPSGFVVLPEAVAHLTKSEEGAPLSAVILGIERESLGVTVFRLGNLVGEATVARSVSVVEDVVEGLSRFAGKETLPSRFIIYDGKEGELEDVKQALTGAQWENYEKIKFLHTPKIEILTPEKKVLATALAGASEIGHVSFVEEKKEEKKEKEENEIENVVVPTMDAAPEEMGFVVGKDIASRPPQEAKVEKSPVLPETPKPFTPPGIAVLSFLNKLKSNFPKLNFNWKASGRTFIFGGIFLALLLVAGFLFWWFYPKASVLIYVSPKKSDETIQVSLNPSASAPDFPKKILPAEILKTDVSGEKTKSTTGTKTVGDKAKGTVKIQNGTAFPVELAAGTIITASNDLQFSLVSDASVSAALSPSTPGEATVDTEAAEIGAEYNLAKDESFKVSNYPKADVDAIATSDFSGGSSNQISAVSADDQKSLEADLKDELIQKGESELTQNLGADKFFIKEAASATASSRIYSAQVGDEATNLKLSLTIGVSVPAVNKNYLNDFAKEVFKDKTPSGYVLRDNQLDFSFRNKGEKAGIINLDFTITANFLPETNTDEIAKAISGRQPQFAEDYLNSIPGFSRAEIKIDPPFPGRLKVLPKVIKNIYVQVEGEK